MIRLSRKLNGIYNTVRYNDRIWIVPRYYPAIVCLEDNEVKCEEGYHLSYPLGMAGVILLQDLDNFYCLSRCNGSLIKVCKNNRSNSTIKFAETNYEVMDAVLLKDSIYVLPLKLSDGIIRISLSKMEYSHIAIKTSEDLIIGSIKKYIQFKNRVIGISSDNNEVILLELETGNFCKINARINHIKGGIIGKDDVLVLLGEKRLVFQNIGGGFREEKVINLKKDYDNILYCKGNIVLTSSSCIAVFSEFNNSFSCNIENEKKDFGGTHYFAIEHIDNNIVLFPWKAEEAIWIDMDTYTVCNKSIEFWSSNFPDMIYEGNCCVDDYIVGIANCDD